MNRNWIFGLVGMTLLAGGLFPGSGSPAGAQEHPNGGVHGTAAHEPGHTPRRDHDDPEHARMQAEVATALGLTVGEFEAELEAGKTVSQIADEQGVDHADLHETILAQHE